MFFESLMFIIGKLTFFTGSVLSGSSFPKPLSKEEESEYFFCGWKLKKIVQSPHRHSEGCGL